MAEKRSSRPRVACLRVKQWLDEWDEIKFEPKSSQGRPSPNFFLCSLKASELKALTGVYRRKAKKGDLRASDPNVQRGHEESRSKTIQEFVRHGFPWCEMGQASRNLSDAGELRKPGWLPTAIIVNILPADSYRHKTKIIKSDLVTIEGEDSRAPTLLLPEGFSGADWKPRSIFPLEVIDGQHRLWAFEGFDPGDDYELPVVMFNGLDHSWQAYLFWSVNITPKKINRSLAFDLYPLLRKETWLDKLQGHSIYRETRCQELVEALWRHESSPWHERINMLGEKASELTGAKLMVSQAAWIRSLTVTFVKPFEVTSPKIGGLFGAPKASDEQVLAWTRPMQAAFLITCGTLLRDAIKNTKSTWAKSLRTAKSPTLFDDMPDEAFYGRFSLLTTDQGVRCILHIFNDMCSVNADALALSEWTADEVFGRAKTSKSAATDDGAVSLCLESLTEQKFTVFLEKIAESLATYDWRTSSFPKLLEEERLRQAVFRGSSGYKEMRLQTLKHLAASGGSVGSTAKDVLKKLP